jgi:pumilio family protein 6
MAAAAAVKEKKANSSGTKRKAEGKDAGKVKKSKVEVEGKKHSRKEAKPEKKEKKEKKPKKVESSEDDSDESMEDGGVPLNAEPEEEDVEMGDADVAEGMHPERLKSFASGQGPNGTNSREAHLKQKALVAERKAAKPLADHLARTKKIWERLRRKSHVPKEERQKLVKELFEIITGKVKDFVLKHDSVRVVQTAIKYATPEQKRMITNELKGTYRQLAESKYAKFLIGKLLVQGDDQIRDTIVPEFFGNVRRMIKHPEASWILDDVYRGVASRQQKATLLREWYGAEFALFQTGEKVPGDLATILEKEPGKRAVIMRELKELINYLIQKKTTGFTMLHDAMLQYYLNAKPGTEEQTEFMELLKGDEEGDLLKNLAFTASGAHVVCLALANGVAKDRKHILKAYKDTLQLMSYDMNGHKVILAAYETIDDTVLTAKSIFPELLTKDAEKQVENVVNAANDLNARTTLLYLFAGRSSSLFPASHTSDLEILKEVDTVRSTTSKKDPEIRRAELAKALSPMLLSAIAGAPAELVSTSFGSQFVTEVLFGAVGDKTAALTAVAQTAGGDPTAADPNAMEVDKPEGDAMEVDGDFKIHGNGPQVHIANTPHGGRMLRSLIAGGKFDNKAKKIVPVEPALNFADILYPVIKNHVLEWATGASSFVPVALLESSSFNHKQELKEKLKKGKKEIQKAAETETPEQKAKAAGIVAAAEKPEEKGKKAKKTKAPITKQVGNAGSRLLLTML